MPYVSVYIDSDEIFGDMDDESLVEELESRGWHCCKQAIDDVEGVNRIEHLVVCGMFADAKTEALRLVERQIGKPNTLTSH